MSTNILPRNFTIKKCLETFEDALFVKKRAQCFHNLNLMLHDKDHGEATPQETIRILDLFQQTLNHDISSIPNALTAVLSLLSHSKAISSIPAQDVLPSILALLQMLKTLQPTDTHHLRTLGVQVFLSYPVEVLTLLIRHDCSGVLEVFEHFTNIIPLGASQLVHMLLRELLSKLPPEEKQQLIKEGIPVWLTTVFVLMNQFSSVDDNNIALENTAFLEELTDNLVDVDYFQCQQWQQILISICQTKTFPTTILNLLKESNSIWHRLWIVVIRLLKNRITRNTAYGTPIQPMLEVVETAFKMDAMNRCKAFQCWDVLIDTLSTDTNQNSVPRYLKLLLIPLKPKNAKTEDTVKAKFDTWWNLIRKFQIKLDDFTDDVVLEFLHFIFGKYVYIKEHVPKLISAGAGQTYDSVKNHCLQAFAEIVGHSANCRCLTWIPKLNEKMLNNKLLASHWDEWMNALKSAIIITSTAHEIEADKVTEVSMHVICVFRSFVFAIAELPPNGVRKDMFDELIQVLADLTETSSISETMSFILLSLTLSLTDDNESIRKLLIASKGDEQSLRKMMSIVLNPKMNVVFERYNTPKLVEILRPLPRFAVSTSNTTSYLDCLVENNSSLKLWAALAHFVNQPMTLYMCVTVKTMKQIIMWPIQAMQKLEVDLETAFVWQRLYDLFIEKTSNRELDADIADFVKDDNNKSNFKVIVATTILKNRLPHLAEDVRAYSQMLENITAAIMQDYKIYEPVIPELVDTITAMIDRALTTSDEKLAKVSLDCVKNILLMFFLMKPQASNEIDPIMFAVLDNIFKSLEALYEMVVFSHIYCDFLEVLSSYVKTAPCKEGSSVFKFILSKINYLRQSCPNDIIKTKIDEIIENSDKNLKKNRKTVEVFTSPNVNKVAKRSKKKEPVIVNTVTENGEEYAVVKSNWKFNPKKLTENQKEKLQRKREDIPALYQDLSQSQDEFKLTKWKTDSQDTTTSSNSKSSKLTTDNDASSILKNIESTDVVPNIMQNILCEKEKNHTSTSNEIDIACIDKSDKVHLIKSLVSTPKKTRSPRMALKDRVFRNVRNLIEKSSPKNGTTDGIVDGDQLHRTPPAKVTKNSNIINSAPSLISTERPSRVKKVPKKFADVQLFGLKKRRYSQSDSHLENEFTISNNLNQQVKEKNTDKTILSIQEDSEASVQQDRVGQSNVAEINKVNFVNDAQELVVTTVSKHKNNEQVLDKIMTADQYKIQNNENNISDIPKDKNDLNYDNNNERDKHEQEDSESSVHSKNLHKKDDVQYSQDNVAPDVQETNSSQCFQKNDDVQDVPMVNIDQDSNKNELNPKRSDGEDTDRLNDDNCINKEIETVNTPVHKTKQAPQKSTAKKSTRKSRIEKELAIDMVEGHPFLKMQSEKRLTRKKLMEAENGSRRKSAPQNCNKTKPQTKTTKSKETELILISPKSCSVTVEETQDRHTSLEEAPCSEDVIESSQDSSYTTTTVKSSKRTPKRLAIVSVERMEINDLDNITGTQDLLQDSDCEMLCVTNNSTNLEIKDDIELPQNKTAEVDKNNSELTENMDTEPINSESITDDVIIINDIETPIAVSSEKYTGTEDEELAEADTQPNDPEALKAEHEQLSIHPDTQNTALDITLSMSPSKLASETAPESQDVIEILTEPDCDDKNNDICSPFKDDAQRKQDFLNNTLEISPIKIVSPDKSKTSPEKKEETSSDYLVVKLSSPVHSNGEPYSSKGSPEFFTEDKTSPDKRDQSPPRVEVVANSGSPSSSLSLKKNRLQSLRPSGRGAHLVGLCVPESMNSKKNPEKMDHEEPRNSSTPARRNLRVLYNAVSDSDGQEKEPDNFLKLKKDLPSVDSSPAVPILKRKIDIVDDTTASPATKRKRVSFHDPPVSTTVSVQKYIKPDCIETPSAGQKRLEVYMTRNSTKSQKRLDNTFKLDTVLSKAIESFTEPSSDSLNNDTSASLDVTPAVEVVITSELNDTDPICPDLVDCKDPIENIAVELSSPAMKDLFIKELDGNVSTVGDLAKMTELEVNRLRIKAPKVQVAKKVLEGYASKRIVTEQDVLLEPMILEDETAIATEMNEDMTEPEVVHTTIETQTDSVSMCENSSQATTEMKLAVTQTSVSTVEIKTQTLESGYKSTSEVITSCLSEREDFITKLGEILPTDTIIDLLVNKSDESRDILTKFLDRRIQKLSNEERNSKVFSILKDFLLERFDQKDMILFCSRLLQGLHDKNS